MFWVLKRTVSLRLKTSKNIGIQNFALNISQAYVYNINNRVHLKRVGTWSGDNRLLNQYLAVALGKLELIMHGTLKPV